MHDVCLIGDNSLLNSDFLCPIATKQNRYYNDQTAFSLAHETRVFTRRMLSYKLTITVIYADCGSVSDVLSQALQNRNESRIVRSEDQ